MFKGSFAGDRWEFAKVIMAAICLAAMVGQIIAGFKMINSNEEERVQATSANYETLQPGINVDGEITELFYSFPIEMQSGGSDEELMAYIVKSDTGKLMLLRAPVESNIAWQLTEFQEGKTDSVAFRGNVKTMGEMYYNAIVFDLRMDKLQKKIAIDGKVDEVLLHNMIDITVATTRITKRVIVLTFVGAGLMLIIALLILRKTFKNAVDSVKSAKGKYQVNYKVTLDDLTFENEGMYEGNEQYGEGFFVNTEHNIRNEGAMEKRKKPIKVSSVTRTTEDGETEEQVFSNTVNGTDEDGVEYVDMSDLPTVYEDAAVNRTADDQPLFYTGEVNEEGNFYVDSTRKSSSTFDSDGFLKKY
ncbi:MAG: hypothetical protein IJ192_14570 [Clostridia bacterium]|nr:hypothetical protein [Clostridia bacterium]